jgi:formate/nitrite transporter FocA (FNT family)
LDAVTADCQTGLARTPLEFAVPAVVCGIATGAVYAFGLAEASGRAAAREPVRSVVVGAAAQLGLILIVPTIAFAAFFGVCARPR